MQLQIVTPEATLFEGNVDGVAVPGVNGEFQMLDNHAPIVSLLTEGTVRILGEVKLDAAVADQFKKIAGATELHIKGGVLEMNGKKAIVLAD